MKPVSVKICCRMERRVEDESFSCVDGSLWHELWDKFEEVNDCVPDGYIITNEIYDEIYDETR